MQLQVEVWYEEYVLALALTHSLTHSLHITVIANYTYIPCRSPATPPIVLLPTYPYLYLYLYRVRHLIPTSALKPV